MGHFCLDVLYGCHAFMQDAGDQGCVRAAAHECVTHIARRSCTAARDYWNIDSIRDRRSQLEVVARTCTIAVDTRDEELTRAAPNALARPRHCIERRRRPSASRVYEPAFAVPLGIDTRDHTLRAES